MALTLVTPATVEPVTLAEAKAHLRVDLADDDALITALIQVARERAETVTARALITQTWEWTLDGWPSKHYWWVPLPPLQSPLIHIKYTNSAGLVTTWPTANYIVDAATQPGRIVLAYGASWPTATLRPANAISIQFKAGYGDDAADVPAAIRQAMLLIIGHLYEHREEVTEGGRFGALEQIPMGAVELLRPYRMRML